MIARAKLRGEIHLGISEFTSNATPRKSPFDALRVERTPKRNAVELAITKIDHLAPRSEPGHRTGASADRRAPGTKEAPFAYSSGLDVGAQFHTWVRPERAWAAWPTNEGLTLVIGGWPYAEFDSNKHDIEGNMLKQFELVPEWAEQIADAKREEKWAGTAVSNYFRTPYGDGWALVGDAGYNRDFITAQGMQDALRDAELLTTALDASFTDAQKFNEAMEDYRRTRDAHVKGIYEFTAMLATLEPPPPEMQQVLHAVSQSQEAMDQFARVAAGGLAPEQFFAPENIGRIMTAAGTR